MVLILLVGLALQVAKEEERLLFPGEFAEEGWRLLPFTRLREAGRCGGLQRTLTNLALLSEEYNRRFCGSSRHSSGHFVYLNSHINF